MEKFFYISFPLIYDQKSTLTHNNKKIASNGSPNKKLQENEKNQTKSDTSDSPNGKENFHKNCKKMPKVFV